MAEKEATVYIVDVGRSMGEPHHDRPVTDLEWAMQYIWDKITATVRLSGPLNVNFLTESGGHRSQDRKCRCNWAQDRW